MCVTRATITGVDLTNGSVIDANTVVTCTADEYAYPSATYRWTNDVTGNTSVGAQFMLTRGMQYKLTCNVSNNPDIPGCYATAYVEFNSELMLYSLCIYVCLWA